MVQLFSQDHTFAHPFHRVTSAFWRKYPNEKAPHVKAIDCLERQIVHLPAGENQPINATQSCLVTSRIISCESAVPGWLNSLGVSNHAYALESTIVNPVTKEMVVKSRNLTGSSLMIMEETCTYRVDPLNPAHTTYNQHAKITAFLPMFSGKFEHFTLNSVQKKSKEGLDTIEQLCMRIKHEGVSALL